MDIKKALSAKMVTPKYGFAVFETSYDGTPCKPTVHFLIKLDGEEYQMTPGWYIDTLLNHPPIVKNWKDEKEVGLYIDYGQNWFIPANHYAMLWEWLKAYANGNSMARSSDSEIINGKVW